MDSLTDEQNTWFNAVRLEDSHDYSSATLAYIDDAARCLGKKLYARGAMSATCAGSCLSSLGDSGNAVLLYSAAASLYEYNAEVGMAKSMSESLWSLLHAFEYYTLISDHVNAERISKKYVDLARRVDRFESKAVFEALRTRRENVLLARSNLGSPELDLTVKDIPHSSKINRAVSALLHQVDATIESNKDVRQRALQDDDEESLVYETEGDLLNNEKRIVS
jgi:hypothetical protein